MGSEGDAVETAIITSTGSTLGTPCYMSPEQSFGEKDIDYRTDIWSLGCILYECLTGKRTVEGDSLGQVVKRLLSEGIRPIAELAPSLPRDLAELVEQMLGRERERRPRDLREVQEVLKRFATATAPDFRAPISEQTATSSDVSRSAETVSFGPKDVTPPTSNTLVLDTVRSAEPTPVQGPETGGAQTVPWGGVMRRRVGVPWVVGAVLLALGLPILAMRSGSRGTTVPSSAAPRASTAAPSEFGSAAVRAAEQAPKEPIPTPSASATPAPEATRATAASMLQPKQDVRTAKPSPRPALAASSVAPPAPSASVAPLVPRPRVGGLAEKPPF
jgi:serine/threonine-protein kinase